MTNIDNKETKKVVSSSPYVNFSHSRMVLVHTITVGEMAITNTKCCAKALSQNANTRALGGEIKTTK